MQIQQIAYKVLSELSEGRISGLDEFIASHRAVAVDMGFMHDAARYNNVKAIDLLLENGFSPNIRNGRHPKQTPLYVAALHGSLDAAKRLLEAGAELEEDNNHTSATPLLGAISIGKMEMVIFY